MTANLTETKKKALDDRMKARLEEYEALERQLEGALGAVEKLRIRRQMQELEQELAEIERDLNQLSASTVDPNRRYIQLTSLLPRLDFKKVEALVGKIFDPDAAGLAVLLLAQESNVMAGERCVERIRDIIKSRVKEIQPYPVAFGPGVSRDEWGLLDRLASHFGAERDAELDVYARRIVERIAGAVTSGRVVFIVVRMWETLTPQERILPWFMESFWRPLVRKLPEITQKHDRVRFIAIILADALLPKESLAPFRWKAGAAFDGERIVELPLQNWTREEISGWLAEYYELERDQADCVARLAYEASRKGTPQMVCSYLESYFGGGG
jgi:hypothetical protein